MSEPVPEIIAESAKKLIVGAALNLSSPQT